MPTIKARFITIDNESNAIILMNALIELNLAFLDTHECPSLYKSGIVYEPESSDEWLTIPYIMAMGSGDCEDLVAWRVAELLSQGREAYAKREATPDPLMWHWIVDLPEGTEDPSVILGRKTL